MVLGFFSTSLNGELSAFSPLLETLLEDRRHHLAEHSYGLMECEASDLMRLGRQ